MALGPLQFCDSKKRSHVLRILCGHALKNFQRCIRLSVGQQIFRQATLCIQIVRLQCQCILIGGDSELGAVAGLVVCSCKSQVDLERTIIRRNTLKNPDGGGQIVLLPVQARKVQHHILGIWIDSASLLELRLRIFDVMLQGVQLTQQQAVFHLAGFDGYNLLKFLNG